MFQFQPNDQKFWTVCHKNITRCTQNMSTEVAIIGGGIAGLSAAQAWSNKGKKVAVFEQFYCASGASGKSTGFITPNCELSFSNISSETSTRSADTAWDFINSGIDRIRTNIKDHNFLCDYSENKGLYVASCKRNLKTVIQEHKDLVKINYQSEYLNKEQLKKILNTDRYYGGVTYDNSFGINPYEYCQELKKILQAQGVEIFEETPVLQINDHALTTPHATITADIIIVCVDKFLPQFGLLKDQVYHVQNFVFVSEKLTPQEIQQIFPQEPYMVWDSELIYNFYRIIQQQRLILGGGSLFSFYNKQENHNNLHAYQKLSNYFAKTFPHIKIGFEYQWPGHIGISKDIAPIAGADKKYPHIYYIAASAGLPIATALGFYSMQHMLEGRTDLDAFLDPDRKYFIRGIMQKILGKRLSFALNNFMVQDILGCFK
jgi:gamma-glutamylputrescine oxidase